MYVTGQPAPADHHALLALAEINDPGVNISTR